MNNLANQLQQHQNSSSAVGATIVSIPLITSNQSNDSNNMISSPNNNVNNKNSTIIQITTPNNNSINTPIHYDNNNGNTTPTTHVKLSNSIKINQLPLNLPTSSIVLTQSGSTNISSPSNPNNNNNTNTNQTNSYGGFAYCSNCKEYGVKAAFYGKSKLYCSVACQNGIKKQQQQLNQGVKRTIEALNYSPNNSPTPSTQLANQQQQQLPHITIPPTTPTTASTAITATNQIPTLIPINSPLIQSNLTISSSTPTIINRLNENTIIINDPTTNSKVVELLAVNNAKNINDYTQNSNVNKQLETQKSAIDITNPQSSINTVNFSRANSVPNTSKPQSSSYSLSSSISSTIDSVLSSLENNNSSINPPPSKRQRNNSIQSNSNSSSNDSSSNIKTNGSNSLSTPNSNNNQFVKQKSSPTNSKSPTSVSPKNSNSQQTFSWTSYIEKENSEAAQVNLFKHVPLSDFWRKISKNIYVEVPNRDPPDVSSIHYPELIFKSKPDSQNQIKFYWFASVVRYAGYYAKLRYVGFDDDNNDDVSNDFWMHMCDKNIHPVGYSTENEFPLVPPNKIINKQNDWKNYLISKLTGYKTLPKSFHELVNRSKKSRFEKGMILELVDKKKLSRMRVGRIIENIGGRLRLKYENAEGFDDFWCHEQSELIHPVGWSMAIGHDIYADEDYKNSCFMKYINNNYTKIECSKDMFKQPREVKKSNNNFKLNMKLEAVDPLNLSSISVATVGKVLKNNYLMIKIDAFPTQEGDMFCYHRSSSSIFPAGFCDKNALDLMPPCDYKKNEKFDWFSYLEEKNAEFAPLELFYDDSNHRNPFKVGMKLESVDLMEPKMICVATVVAVVNRLIRLSFDGWSKEYDQWVDCESCDIYPIGWCQLFNYPLQPPLNGNPDSDTNKKKGKRTYNKKKI